MLSRKIYLNPINKFKKKLLKEKNTPYIAWAKLVSLVNLVCRFESYSIKKKLKKHPFFILKRLVLETITMFNNLLEAEHIQDKKKMSLEKYYDKETLHENLFNIIWDKYNKKEFQKYIDRYKYRIKINKLDIKNKKIIDLGCGNGVFCFALIEMGAKEVVGIDFGSKSLKFANSIAKKFYKNKKIKFLKRNVYKTGFKNNYFDFAIQNGVFHHLKKEQLAIRETSRILKPNGKFWYYSAGLNDMANELLNLARETTKNIPHHFKFNIYSSLNMSINKKVHLMDGFTAVYERTTYKSLTEILKKNNFKNFSMLKGGFSTDKDQDMIKKFDYGKERYGEGDLRILCENNK